MLPHDHVYRGENLAGGCIQCGLPYPGLAEGCTSTAKRHLAEALILAYIGCAGMADPIVETVDRAYAWAEEILRRRA